LVVLTQKPENVIFSTVLDGYISELGSEGGDIESRDFHEIGSLEGARELKVVVAIDEACQWISAIAITVCFERFQTSIWPISYGSQLLPAPAWD
jgi:hypothetical protein